MRDLQVADLPAYRARLEGDPAEWCALDQCCHITISRFFREKHVFDALRACVLPGIAARAKRECRSARIWSAGCASGEEPFTLKILWDLEVTSSFPGTILLSIIATDADAAMLARAQQACFRAGSLRELPRPLIEQAFDRAGPLYCVKPQYRDGVKYLHQDLRFEAPAGPFDLILCRYVAFTYFAPPLQKQVLLRLLERLLPDGYLVIGGEERLPCDFAALVPLQGTPQIFQKAPGNRAESANEDAQP